MDCPGVMAFPVVASGTSWIPGIEPKGFSSHPHDDPWQISINAVCEIFSRKEILWGVTGIVHAPEAATAQAAAIKIHCSRLIRRQFNHPTSDPRTPPKNVPKTGHMK